MTIKHGKETYAYQLTSLFLLFVLVALTACSSGGGGGATPTPAEQTPVPLVTAVGTAFGSVSSSEVGPDGGTVKTADGRLSLRFPAGAVSTKTMISVQSISAEAPAAVSAWRLGPEGLTFNEPVELVSSYTDEDVVGSAPEALQIGFQNADGVWSVLKQVTLDATAKTLTAKTTHFSDWSLLQGMQLRPPDPTVMIGESVDLIVNYCMLVDDPGDELSSLRANCEPGDLLQASSDWSVNGAPGGVTALGMVVQSAIDTGTYTAPGTKPTPSRVAVSTVISNTSSGQRTTLVSNVTIVDVRGWSGSVSYNASGSKTTDETTVAGTTSTNTRIVTTVAGRGSISFEPGAIPDTMTSTIGSGTWTESSVRTDVATDSQPVCPQVNSVVDYVELSGQATNPAGAFALLSITGNTYQISVETLSGFLTGTQRTTASGTLTGGSGTNCVAPAVSDNPAAIGGYFAGEGLLLEGTIDAATPNVIKGQKTFTFGTIPVQYLVDWQFQK